MGRPRSQATSKGEGQIPVKDWAVSLKTPARATVTKVILDDLTSPLVPADAAELFAVAVMDQLLELSPETAVRFDRSWFIVFVDLAVAVTNRCPEESIMKALETIEADEKKRGLLARVLRRRFARSLPAEAVAQLDDTGRYWLSRAAIEAAGAAVKDKELWEALWGRKTGWLPVPMIAREPHEGNSTSIPENSDDKEAE
jgi:hypothetical protein